MPLKSNLEQNRPFLMAEDEESDIDLLEKALVRIGNPVKIHFVNNGKQVIDYLAGKEPFSNRTQYPFPGALFLDLKMPVMDGFEVLEWIKSHPECRVIPTIIYSSSALSEDVWRAYRLGANSYLVKPGNFQDMAQLIKMTFDFWTHCAIPFLPSQAKIAI